MGNIDFRNSIIITPIPINEPPVFQALIAPGLLSPTILTSFPEKSFVSKIEKGIDPQRNAIIEYINVFTKNIVY
jgi:hypothetical protein